VKKNNAPRPYAGPSPADRAKGDAAERAFAEWLDASVLPHLYVEQSPLTVPAPLRGQIKRPDYLVGIPGVGLVAFDVKAKTVYERDGLIFDLEEVQKLRNFARLFHLTVYFACIDPQGGLDGYWVRLDQLDAAPAVRRAGKLTLALPCDRALPVAMDEGFYSAFVRAVELA
jgi:Holliday junction resolvase